MRDPKKEIAVDVVKQRPTQELKRSQSQSINERIIHCTLCQDPHVVTVDEADRWLREMRERHQQRVMFCRTIGTAIIAGGGVGRWCGKDGSLLGLRAAHPILGSPRAAS